MDKKRLSFLLPLLPALLGADQMLVESLACPEISQIEKAASLTDDIMALNQYTIANGCKVLSPSSDIETIDSDAATGQTLFLKVLDKRSGDQLYVLRKRVQIEKPGSKNTLRF